MGLSTEQEAREEIVAICRLLHGRGYLASADGNVSYRLSNERILITPSGTHKGFIRPADIAIMTIDGKVLAGKPSSELLMHLEVYRQCDEARCVVHAHPPIAVAWTVAYPDLEELPSRCLSEVILAAGRIPIVPYARPGTADMGTNLAKDLPTHRLFILARHGALCWGESLMEAYGGIERLEHSAQILKAAKELGGLTNLPDDEVQELLKMRVKIGNRIL